uniref:GHMP_kinases_N domain-containing protein n=1 Tax=Macrostomum lignano TaxID=282301 RepID=A0A1I8F6R7_9PLAT
MWTHQKLSQHCCLDSRVCDRCVRASAKLLSRLSSAWQQNRQLSLVPLDEGGNSTSALLAATLALCCAYPVLLNDTGNDCPYCQLSPANLHGSVRTLRTTVLGPDSDRWRSVGVAAAMQIIRDSLVERAVRAAVPLESVGDARLSRLVRPRLRARLDAGAGHPAAQLAGGPHLIIGLKMVSTGGSVLLRWLRLVTPEGFEVNVTGLAIDMLDEIARRLKFTKIDFAIGPYHDDGDPADRD